MRGYPVKDLFVIGVDSGYPPREHTLSVSILRAVVTSERLRQWLTPQIHEKKQARAGKWLGLAQATINRIVNQDDYDFKLNTVGQIATALGFTELSDFFRALESSQEISAGLQMTGSVTAIGDNNTASLVKGGSRASALVHQSAVDVALAEALIMAGTRLLAGASASGLARPAPAVEQSRPKESGKRQRGAKSR